MAMTKAEICRRYAQRHPDRLKLQRKKWQQSHRDKVAIIDKRYRLKNVEKIKAYKKKYADEHTAQMAEKARRWRAKNKEHHLATVKKWQSGHRELVLSYNRKSRIANRVKHRAAIAAWSKAHPNKILEYSATRRARKRGAFVEVVIRSVVYQRDGGRCHLCGKKRPANSWHLDHIVPLSKNGTHCYANVAVACPGCNMRKCNKIIGQMRFF